MSKGNSISPEAVLAKFQAEGYAVLGFVFVKQQENSDNEWFIIWNSDVPQEARDAICRAELERDFDVLGKVKLT